MQIGTVLSLPGAALSELAGIALDFAWIDLEHGALGLADVQAMAVGLTAAGCSAHVRLPSIGTDQLAAILDAGVDGVVAPRVESAAEARALVARLRYPPTGRRGFGPRRAGRYGRVGTFWNDPENQVACTVQIESQAGVRAAREITAVDGVDTIVVGCGDLSLDLDAPGALDSSSVRNAVAAVASAAASAEIRFGIAGSGDPHDLVKLCADRADVLVYSADVRIYSAAMDASVRSLEEVHAAG